MAFKIKKSSQNLRVHLKPKTDETNQFFNNKTNVLIFVPPHDVMLLCLPIFVKIIKFHL